MSKVNGSIGADSGQPSTGWGSFFLLAVFMTALTLLSFKIKTPGVEALRPFHYSGIGVLLFLVVAVLHSFHKVVSEALRSNSLLLILWVLLYVFEFISAAGDAGRSIRDFIMGTAIDFGLFIILIGAGYKQIQSSGRSGFFILFSWLIIIYVLVSIVIAWLMYYGAAYELLNMHIANNDAWGTRLHGILGEPTHFGMTVGLGVIATLNIFILNKNKVLSILLATALVLMGATLFATGSNNTMLSLLVAFVVFLVFSNSRPKSAIAMVLVLLGGWIAMTQLIDSLDGRAVSGLARIEKALEEEKKAKAKGQKEKMAPEKMVPALEVVATKKEFTASDQQPVVNEKKPVLQLVTKEEIRAAPESTKHIVDSFRLDQPAVLTGRIERLKIALEALREASVEEVLFGKGYGVLERDLHTSFNGYLDVVLRFGLVYLCFLIGFLTMLTIKLFQAARDSGHEALLALAVLLYGSAFLFNLSVWHTAFFHMGNFCFILALSIAVLLNIKINNNA